MRMGPPPRSPAAEAHGCFMVRIPGGSDRIQGRGARLAPEGGLPSEESISKAARKEKTPRRGGMPGPLNGPGRTMMRDRMRQESSTHASRQDRPGLRCRPRWSTAPWHGSLRTLLTTATTEQRREDFRNGYTDL